MFNTKRKRKRYYSDQLAEDLADRLTGKEKPRPKECAPASPQKKLLSGIAKEKTFGAPINTYVPIGPTKSSAVHSLFQPPVTFVTSGMTMMPFSVSSAVAITKSQDIGVAPDGITSTFFEATAVILAGDLVCLDDLPIRVTPWLSDHGGHSSRSPIGVAMTAAAAGGLVRVSLVNQPMGGVMQKPDAVCPMCGGHHAKGAPHDQPCATCGIIGGHHPYCPEDHPEES